VTHIRNIQEGWGQCSKLFNPDNTMIASSTDELIIYCSISRIGKKTRGFEKEMMEGKQKNVLSWYIITW